MELDGDAYSYDWTEVGHNSFSNIWEAIKYAADAENPLFDAGDSGGPMLRHDGVLCGAVSSPAAYWSLGWSWFSFVEITWNIDMRFARVDSVKAIDWLRPRLFVNDSDLGAHGDLKGVCPSGFINNPAVNRDSDGDWIPDACDPCPFEHDVDYVDREHDDSPDTDGDGLPDRCDMCPRMFENGLSWNPVEQVDTDGDGIGDNCDWDVDIESNNSLAENPNMEAELVMSYPGRGEFSDPLVLDGPDLAARQQLYRDTFAVYSKDHVPSSLVQLTDTGSALPVASILAMSAGTELGCGSPEAKVMETVFEGYKCEETLRNRITHTTVVPNAPHASYVSSASGRSGTVKSKFCDCPLADSDSFEDRFLCRQAPWDCFPNPDQLDTLPLTWLDVDTVPFDDTYVSGVDPTWNVSVSVDPTYTYNFNQNARSRDLLWDFSQLGNGCTNPDNSGAHHCEHGLPRVEGVLWNSLRTMTGLRDNAPTPGLVALDEILWRGGSYWSGTAGYDIEISGHTRRFHPKMPDVLYYPCQFFGCDDALDKVEQVINPADFRTLARYAHVFDGIQTKGGGFGDGTYQRSGRVLSDEVALTFAYAADSGARMTLAAESTADIGITSERLELRGLTMEGNSLTASSLLYWDTQTRSLESTALPGMDNEYEAHFMSFAREGRNIDSAEGSEVSRVAAALSAAPTGAVPRRLRDDQGFVLSGSTLQAFVFGGLNRWEHPRKNARIWDLETNSWTKVRLDYHARVGEVVAATYNPHDGFVYVWDRKLDVWHWRSTMRLTRWEPGSSRFELVAELSDEWKGFDEHWLTVGSDGSLALVGTRDDSTAVGRLNLGYDGEPEFMGVSTLNARVTSRPVVTPTRVIVAIADGEDWVQTPLHDYRFNHCSDWTLEMASEESGRSCEYN